MSHFIRTERGKFYFDIESQGIKYDDKHFKQIFPMADAIDICGDYLYIAENEYYKPYDYITFKIESTQ